MTRHESFDAELGERRDADTIQKTLPIFELLFRRYHHATVDGLEHVPDGPALAVGNHNGGIMSPDMFALMAAWWRHFGVDSPAYGLMHDLPFRLPVVGELMPRLGAVHARPANAVELLRRGAKVLVYPGGDIDAFRPWHRRHEVVFGERTGFIRVALRAGAPIVPVVSAGAHESFRILTDGREIVRRLGLKKLARVEVLPIILCLPWGVTVGTGFYWPLPVRIRIRVLAPIRWPELGPEAADDDAIVWRCREQVRAAMQTALDELTREGGLGLRGRFA
jgi:1-acyl-sn-glycerol-3-phosphate acyltransferase